MIYFSRWSLFCAILLGSLLILLFHFGICREKIAFKKAIIPYFVLLFFIFLRIVLPIDSDAFIVLRSKYVLTVMSNLWKIQVYKRITIGMAFYAIWGSGAIISLCGWGMVLKRDVRKSRELKMNSNPISNEYSYIAKRVGLDPNRIFVSDKTGEVVTVGIKDYMILLPELDYSENDMINILSHEASHVEHADILIRMVLHVFCCLFWWNPIFKLLESDYAILMEYRCDENAVKHCSLAEKIDYVETLKKMAIIKADFSYRYMEAGFAVATRKSMLILRARRVLENGKPNPRGIVGVILIELVMFFLSYSVVVQPFYEPSSTYVEGEVKIDCSNAYLEEIDGAYRLYVDEDYWGIIPDDEIKIEPYCRLEIRR